MSNVKEFIGERPFLIHVFMYLVIVGSLFLLYQSQENQEDDALISIVAGCERANVIRTIQANQLKQQAQQTNDLPRSYFPEIPDEEYERLLRQQNRRTHNAIEALKPIDCQLVYPGAEDVQLTKKQMKEFGIVFPNKNNVFKPEPQAQQSTNSSEKPQSEDGGENTATGQVSQPSQTPSGGAVGTDPSGGGESAPPATGTPQTPPDNTPPVNPPPSNPPSNPNPPANPPNPNTGQNIIEDTLGTVQETVEGVNDSACNRLGVCLP